MSAKNRNVLIVVGGVILSFVLFSIGVWIFLQASSQGQWIRESGGRMPEYQETVEKYGDPFDMMARGMRVIDFLLFPLVALLTGAFVGLVARSAVWQPAAISLTPLALLFLAGHSWDLKAFLFSGVYLVLCGVASLLLHKLKGKKLAAGTAHV